MFESIPQNTVTGASVNCLAGGSAFCGPDIMTAVEMMLVKDYDDQLKSTAAEMKTMTKVKQKYREIIKNLNNMLGHQTQEVGDSKTPCVTLSTSEQNYLHTLYEPIGNTETCGVTTNETHLNANDAAYIKPIKGNQYSKDSITTQIENYKMKLDTVNEQSEMTSLDLQTLTNQRKIAFETVSNIIKKQEDAVGTIIRNIS